MQNLSYWSAARLVYVLGAALFILFIGLKFASLDWLSLLYAFAVIAIASFMAYTARRGPAGVSARFAREAYEQGSAYLRQIIFLGTPAFIALAAWVAYDLSQLESGQLESVRIWAPIALLYEYCGYWFAIMCIPGLSIFIIGGLLRKVAVAQLQENQIPLD